MSLTMTATTTTRGSFESPARSSYSYNGGSLSTAAKAQYPVVYDSYDYLCKLLVIGDSGCGKSALLKRFADDEFHPGYASTIGVDFEVRTIDVGSKKVKMQMWDTAGQERFRTITSSYYRGAHAVLIVFDVTQEESFRSVAKWLAELHAVHSGGVGGSRASNAQVLLVANKTDLTRARVVEPHRIAALAAELGLPFIETSAKTNSNVAEAFQTIARSFVQQRVRDGATGGDGRDGRKNVNGVSIEEDGSGSAWRRCFGACTIM